MSLHFPSEREIISYLEQHPLTSDPYLKEKKIIETVAKFFANQDKADMGVDIGVMLTMHDLNEKIKLPETAVMAINLNLTAALKDCANGKKIELKKSNDNL